MDPEETKENIREWRRRIAIAEKTLRRTKPGTIENDMARSWLAHCDVNFDAWMDKWLDGKH